MDVTPMNCARKRVRHVRATSPGTLSAFRALPVEHRRRVRVLVYRRGYSLERAMDIPTEWLMDHILYGYTYRRPWTPFKSFVVVTVVVLIVLSVFSLFWM